MVLEVILLIIFGILAGTFTGLAPGIHINLISTIVISSLPFFSFLSPISLVIFIVSMSITHTFIDFIPSIYLGAPDEDTFLSTLPGHKFLKEGLGHEAVVITLYGSIIAIIIGLIFLPVFLFFLPKFYNLIQKIIPFILLFISTYIILADKNRFISLSCFFLAGALGFITFKLSIENPLMPLLTGLFGISSLIVSLKQKTIIKKQILPTLKEIKLTKSELTRGILASFIAAPICSFLPGIGSGHAATIGSEIVEQNNKSFLFLTGAVNTIVMFLSFIAVYSINKARSGSALAIKQIIPELTNINLSLILFAVLVSALLSFVIGIFLSKKMSNIMNKINYTKITILVIIILFIFNILFSNFLGILVLITSTFIGIFTIYSDTKRINLMGSLIIPVVIYYLFN